VTEDFSRLSRQIASLHGDGFDIALSRGDLDPDPIVQFARWLDDALAMRPDMPNLMTLATSTPDGAPSARTVLLKSIEPEGFVFFTNYESRKGKELGANPRAALVFHWPEVHRQVNVTGDVARVSGAESDEYFRSRPLESKLGTWASRQSRVIESREALEEQVRVAAEEFPNGEVPRPPYWGGFRLVPNTVEFWQGRANRLHDRFRYTRTEDTWKVDRLSP
jgi:pyridoxamine 5'-phosphate oxidase